MRQGPDVGWDKLEPASYHILEPERAWEAGAYDPAISYLQKMPVVGLETSSAKFAFLLIGTPFSKPAQRVDKALSGPIVSVGKSWGGWVICHGYALGAEGNPEKLSEQLHVQVTQSRNHGLYLVEAEAELRELNSLHT